LNKTVVFTRLLLQIVTPHGKNLYTKKLLSARWSISALLGRKGDKSSYCASLNVISSILYQSKWPAGDTKQNGDSLLLLLLLLIRTVF